MKKLITLLALLIVTLTSFATNYYVSNSGSDAATGTLAAPWANITKVNNSMGVFVAGDSILFERGGTFTGTLNVTKAGIIISAYGTGNKPILTGFYTIPSWTSAGTNLWSATIPAGLNWVRLLTINDRVTRVGRQPNYADNATAWYRYNSALAAVSPINVPTSTAIPTNLADGELVLCKYNWYLDVMPINTISGTTVNCNNPRGLYGIAAGPGNDRGFFVQNSINALDVQNEWHYNNSTKVVTMFSTTNPSTLGTIKIPRQTNIVTLGGTSSVTLDNLELQGCSEKAITATGSNITIKNCNVKYVQGWGIDIGGSNFNIQNNWIRDIGSNGIYVSQTGNISGNLIETCGNIEGLAGLTNSGAGTQNNQSDQHIGINIETSYSGSVTCRFNTIDSTGYNGIRWYGSNVTIEKNYINYPCMTKSDGGGIYTWQELVSPAFTNQVVKNNIILNSGKYLFGTETPGLNVNSYGIYLDAGSRNIIVDSNVIGPCLYGPNSFCAPNPIQTVYNGGLYFNGVQNITTRKNIVTGWPSGITLFRQTAAKVPVLNGVISGLYITKNAFYVSGAGSGLCDIETSERYYDYGGSAPATLISQIQGFGTIDSNYVSGTNVPSPFMYGSDGGNAGFPLTLARWRSETGKDLNSVSFPNTTPTFIINYGSTGADTTINFNGFSKKDYAGVVYNNFMTIPPYYGTLLFDNGTTTPLPTVTSYYISNTGDDTKDGKSPATAWKTITKLNNSWSLINPGDNILFERGGTFTGSISPTKSGTSSSRIVIDAYGTGANPVISGMTTATGWTLTATPNIYVATVNTTVDINLLTTDGVLQRIGRWPNYNAANDGWRSTSSRTNTSITDASFGSSGSPTNNWTGAKIVVRPYAWIIDVNSVTSQTVAGSSSTINFTSSTGQPLAINTGYFIQNDLRTLDIDGEWYFNNATNQLYLYSTSNPSSRVVKVATADRLLDLSGDSYITVQNINFEGAHNYGIFASSSNNITIQNCTIRYVNKDGVLFPSSTSTIFNNNLIRDCLNNGVYLAYQATVNNNTLRNIATYEGMGQGDNAQYRALVLENQTGNQSLSNFTCQYNTIDSTGYNGIDMQGSNTLIQYNFIKHTHLCKQDGGPIYSYCADINGNVVTKSNRVVRDNIIDSCGRVLYGGPDNVQTMGIYMDGNSNNVLIYNNVIGNILGPGVLMNDVTNITVRSNVIYNVNQAISLNRFEVNGVPRPPNRNVRTVSNVYYPIANALWDPNLSPNNWFYTTPNICYDAGTTTLAQEILNMGFSDSNWVRDDIPVTSQSGPFNYYYQRNPPSCAPCPEPNLPNCGCGTAPYEYYCDPPGKTLAQWRTLLAAGSWDVNSQALRTDKGAPILVYNETTSPKTISFSGLSRISYNGIVYNNSITLQPFTGTLLYANGTTGGVVVTATANPATIACFGGTTTVTVSATGGTAPYTGTGSFTRAAGTYTFTVTDATTPTANSGSTTITLTQPSAALVVSLVATNVTCFNQANGSINTTVTGGTTPYAYNWGLGVTTQNRTSLTPNTYTLVVTDARGCQSGQSASISQPTQLFFGIPTSGKITSIGGTTTVTIPIATGGTTPYQYSINGGTTYQLSNSFTGITAGTKNVVVKDANNCLSSRTFVITQPNNPLIINRPVINTTYLQGRTLSERLGAFLCDSGEYDNIRFKLEKRPVIEFASNYKSSARVKLNLKNNVFIFKASDLTTETPSVHVKLVNDNLLDRILQP